MDNRNHDSNGHSLNSVAQESPLQEYVSIILRGKWVIVMSLVAVVAATALFTFKTKPVYESTSLVLIDMKGQQGSLPFLDLTGTATANKITNELEILKTRSMAEAVSRALLKKEYLDESKSERIPILHVLVDGEPQEKLATESQVTGKLLQSVGFSPIRDSDIIKITAKSTEPREAALLANTYTEVYAERNLNASRLRSKAVREFLQTQLAAKRAALDNAENVLQRYMRSSGMVSLDADVNKVVEQLSRLEANRDAIEVDITSRSKTLDSYKQELAKQEPNVARAIGESNNAYIRILQEQLATLEVKRDVVIAQNPTLIGQEIYSDKLREIDAQVASLKKNLQERTKAFLESSLPGDGGAGFVTQARQKIIEQQIELQGLYARKDALGNVISNYEKQFNQIPRKSIELAKLQRARLSSEKLYLLVEEKFDEAAITEKSEFGYVDIIEAAIVPFTPVSPKVEQNLLLGALMGLGLGVAIVFLRAYLDVHVRTPEDLKRYGYVPLSAISQMDEEIREIQASRPVASNGKQFDPHLVSLFNPLSPLAESYRRLRTNVQYAQLDKPLKSIMITSANPKEGKSTTVSNLAIAFAQTEKKVLLVDADMRRPILHTFFCLPKDPGLTDLLFGKSLFEEVVQKDVQKNLDIVGCGTVPPNPAEILGSRKMQEFVDQINQVYDVVLFDSPPLLAVTDAAVLATGVDGSILVVSAGKTRAPAIERASEFLTGVGGKVLGVVLNNFDIRKAYGGYYGSYRYGYYGYGYGYYQSSDGGRKKKEHA